MGLYLSIDFETRKAALNIVSPVIQSELYPKMSFYLGKVYLIETEQRYKKKDSSRFLSVENENRWSIEKQKKERGDETMYANEENITYLDLSNFPVLLVYSPETDYWTIDNPIEY